MEDKINIEELFSSKLKNAEAPVNPKIWTNVSAGISSGGATSVGLLSTKLIAWVASIIGLIGIGTIVYFSQKEEQKPIISENKKEQVQNKQVEKQDKILSDSKKTNEPATRKEITKVETISTKLENNEKIDTEILIPTNSQEFEENLESTITLPRKSLELMDELNEDQFEIKQDVVQKSSLSNSIVGEENNIENIKTIAEVNQEEIRLPNVFSPNNDGVEDEFFIENLDNVSDFQIIILNDKNQVVFQSNDSSFRWDGKNQAGETVQKGNYIYYLTGINSDNSKFKKSSILTVR